MNPTDYANQPALSTDRKPLVLTMESTIRDMAATVVSGCRNRVDHPSFGNTKASIRASAARMEGAIGLYMVVTQQAAHAGVPALARFLEDYTTQQVHAARRAVESL